jgi:hypothetical protein
MIYKSATPVVRHAAESHKAGSMSFTQHVEMAAGCFTCWLETTSCDHHAVIAQAAALMRVHQRVSKTDELLFRQAH